MFEIPILLLVFNRPWYTKIVLEEVKKIKPAYIYVAADGPRNDKPGEKQVCDDVRNMVLTGIDWKCEVKTLFRNENLGCGKGVADAITWFFENVEQGIILEDDVVPNQSFFLFCEAMLIKFKDDESVMHVSGNNFQLGQIGNDCYYLSRIPHSWGWATWKSAWDKFDFSLKYFNEDQIQSYFNDYLIDNHWHQVFQMTKKEWHKHVWDYQWIFAVFYNKGFSILPQSNLVSNIGFGLYSTHTTDTTNYLANLKKYEMDINIGEAALIYDPVADFNFHKLFLLEPMKPSKINITAKEALLILLSKFKHKVGKI